MSDKANEASYLRDLIRRCLGGDSIGDTQKWSPNNLKSLVIKDGVMVATNWDGSEVQHVVYDFSHSQEDVLLPFRDNFYANLEVLDVGKEHSQGMPERYFKSGRLHTVGGTEVPNEGWSDRFRLQPEKYSLDSRIKNKIGDDSNHAFEEELLDFYRPTVNGVVSGILDEYDFMFESGYEVISPVGILIEDTNGRGVLYNIDKANRAYQVKKSLLVQNLWKKVQGVLNLTVRSERLDKDIANAVLGAKKGERLYFPYKMLEYAFGRENRKSGDDSNLYPEHSKSSSWKGYRESEVRPSLTKLFGVSLRVQLQHAGLVEKYDSDEAKALVESTIDKLKTCFTVCVLVSKYVELKGNPSSLKVRVMEPWGLRQKMGNLSREVFQMTTQYTGGKHGKSFEPIHNSLTSEFYHENDHVLVNAAPIFFYHALEALQNRGEKLDAKSIILGIDSRDRILKAGEGSRIDITRNLTHSNCASSRAGKGVFTLAVKANFLASRVATFYLDDKPDMGSLVLQLNPSAFSVNGGTYSNDPVAGFDYFNAFGNRDSWVNKNNVPDYLVPTIFPSKRYDDLGAVVYARAMMLVMGIIGARAESPEARNAMGGEEGVLLIADEMNIAQNDINNFLNRVLSGHYANSNYAILYKEYQEAYDQYEKDMEEWSPGSGPKPRPPAKISVPVAKQEDYWVSEFYKSLRVSVMKLQQLNRAGLKNMEAKSSNIFVISQDLLDPITSFDEVDDLFKRRNKNDNNPASGVKNPNLLASLCMVGGIDAFLGYNAEKQYLFTEGGKGDGKVDSVARNFGYLPTYPFEMAGGETPKPSVRESYAQRATFFKPFLLFIESGEEKPFCKKMFEFSAEAGISREDLISQNEGEPGKLHKGVGFQDFLSMLNGGESAAFDSIQKASDYANLTVQKMGYTGTWRDFLLDMRPQWIFSIEDVVNAWKGSFVHNDYEARFSEFYTVYPEEFPNSQQGSAELEEDDIDIFDDYSNIQYGGIDSESTPIEEESVPISVDEPSNYGGNSDPYTGESFNVPEAVNVPPLSDPYVNANPEQAIARQGYVRDYLTALFYQQIGGKVRVKSVAVVGGAVAGNGVLYRCNIDENTMGVLPIDVSWEVKQGNYAKVIKWESLRGCNNLQSITVDSPNFIRENINPALGFGNSISIERYFNTFRSLQTIKIGNRVFNRGNYKKEINMANEFYNPPVYTKVAMMAESGIKRVSKAAWGYTQSVFHGERGYTSMWGKAIGLLAGGTLTVGAGVGAVASRGVKGLFDAIGGVFDALKEG